MRTKDITDCFEIGWLAGFSITIRIIQCWCVPITDTWHGAWAIGKGRGRAAGGFLRAKPGPVTTPPTPGWRKNRGRVPGPGRSYFSAIQNHLLKTGGTGKTGGHDF